MECWSNDRDVTGAVFGSARFQRAVFGILPKTEHGPTDAFGRMPRCNGLTM